MKIPKIALIALAVFLCIVVVADINIGIYLTSILFSVMGIGTGIFFIKEDSKIYGYIVTILFAIILIVSIVGMIEGRGFL